MPPDPPRMVVPSALPLKLICDVTRLWRNFAPPRKFSAYATAYNHAMKWTNRDRRGKGGLLKTLLLCKIPPALAITTKTDLHSQLKKFFLWPRLFDCVSKSQYALHFVFATPLNIPNPEYCATSVLVLNKFVRAKTTQKQRNHLIYVYHSTWPFWPKQLQLDANNLANTTTLVIRVKTCKSFTFVNTQHMRQPSTLHYHLSAITNEC